MTPRLDRAERRREFRDLLSRSSLDCPRKPISCGHMLVDHGDSEDWDENGRPVSPACRLCDCDGIS